MKILIRNGTIVTSSDKYKSDIFLLNGKISCIESGIESSDIDKIIDASECLIFPGGIDPHVHMYLPALTGYSSDDFLTGSIAALFGGTTTLLDFVTPVKGESLTDSLKQRKEEAKSSMADFSFHVSVVEWSNTTEQEINDCIREGVSSFKVYMAYKDTVGLSERDLKRVMKAVGKAGGLVTVHCELGDEIDKLRNDFYEKHQVEPKYHPLSRPAELEAGAVKSAIDMANLANSAIYIVHVSSKKSLNHIMEAQSRGRFSLKHVPSILFLMIRGITEILSGQFHIL